MRRLWLAACIGLLSVSAWSQESPSARPARAPAAPPNRSQQHIQRRQKLALEEEENRVQFEREMNRLKLAQRRLELQRQRRQQNFPESAPQPAPTPAFRGVPPDGPQARTAVSPAHRRMMACRCARGMGFLMLLCATIHILLAVWVYQDIRRRNAGSGIWIVVALLTGLLGTAVYALVRIGDPTT